jgi:apolipoprotein N-acyltransferase
LNGRPGGLAALSGVLLALSFPKFGHSFVAWIALLPLLLALRGAAPGRAFRLGYVTGFVAGLGILYWTALVVVQYGGVSQPLALIAMVLLCMAVALFPALFAWLVARWLAAFGPVGLLLAPVAWVATEMLRSHALYRFAWCLLGYSQQENLGLIQIASYTAVYGVSFLVASPAAAIAYAAASRAARGTAALAACAALVGLVWLHGTRVLAGPAPSGPTIRVGLIQANIRQEEKWDPTRADANIEAHLSLTKTAAEFGARLVVWPESALPFLFDRNPELAQGLRSLARARQLYILFGNDDVEDAPAGPRVWVGAKMLGPDGELALRYHKMRLVPFGEYVPLQPLITLGGTFAARLVSRAGEFAPGTDYSLGSLDGRRVSAFICYEAIFPDLVRQFRARGSELLVNITNDAWYGTTSAPYQHFSMAVFRAVENGVWLVRAANTGITAVVDTRGRVVERTALFERTLLVRDVPMVAGATFYSRHGDVFGWSCLALASLLWLVSSGRGRRSPDVARLRRGNAQPPARPAGPRSLRGRLVE